MKTWPFDARNIKRAGTVARPELSNHIKRKIVCSVPTRH